MTVKEVRESKDYIEAMEKIKGYKKGFTFTLNFTTIPKPQGNALKIIIRDCIKDGILESVSVGLDISGNQVEETYKRL